MPSSAAEAAVVSAVNSTTGEAVSAFVVLRGNTIKDPDVVVILRNQVGKEDGPIAKPCQILVVPELPKTRSGKIMRPIT